MNVNAHREWRAIVDAHYGSLAAFRDGRTVRHMLEMLERQLAEDKRIGATIKSRAGRKDWRDTFAAERAYATEQCRELRAWLKARA